jgi:nucleotide-binding universal stress UspA family protein
VAVFESVILAVDGSEESRKAADLVRALADRLGNIIVLHVREVSYSGAASWSPEWTPDLEDWMRDLVDSLRSAGAEARTEIKDRVRGHAGETITDLASGVGADLIVMGSKGRSRVTGFVLGSVAGSVVHSAPCPVLIAR